MTNKTSVDDLRATQTEAYRLGRQNKWDNLSGPNPYAEESQDWHDWELGWGANETVEEEKIRFNNEMQSD